ncbi:MAG: hypothetical protein AMS27_04100 [Bacteroides sp. SM23_62_1]|nr:MAG: hypothetical protein AMS27_04100 [Bacteroides sp. SM23_62_1]
MAYDLRQMITEKKYIRTYRILTVILSSLLIILILSAWIRESLFSEWKRYQHEFIDIIEKMAESIGADRDFVGVEVGIREYDLQDLIRIDRCITCHLGIDDPGMVNVMQPHSAHTGEYLNDHQPQRFGCTICHGGQGRALDKETAFGRNADAYWSSPLLDQPYIQSSCGKCHLALFTEGNELAGTEIFRIGQQVFNREGCLGCHRARGVGVTVGPDLTEQGEKTKHEYNFQNVKGEQTVSNWLKEHFRDPEMVSPGSQMLKISLQEEELEALVTFVMGLARPEIPYTYYSVETLNELKGARNLLNGIQIFQYCCSACHGKEREGKNYNEYKTGVPALSNRDFLSMASSELIRFTVLNGRGTRPMASWFPEFSGLFVQEVDSLIQLIRNGRLFQSSFDGMKNRHGNHGRGQIIYHSHCRMCHGENGEGQVGLALNNPDIQKTITDMFYYLTIRNGRYNTAMPSWFWFDDQEMSDLLALIRSWGSRYSILPGSYLPEGDPQKGFLQFHYLCSRCHGEFGEGETGPSILNKNFLAVADNEYLYRTIAFGRARTAMFGWKGQEAGQEIIKENQIADIIAYMRSVMDKTWDYIYPGTNPGNMEEGRKIFISHCAGCHGENGNGILAPQLHNQDFLNAATNGYIMATITLGRTGTDMPSWGRGDEKHPALSGKERQDVVAFVRSWQVIKIKRWEYVTPLEK